MNDTTNAPNIVATMARDLHPLLADQIRELLQSVNAQAAEMVHSSSERVRDQGGELARQILSASLLSAVVAPEYAAPQHHRSGFWDQVSADANAVIDHMVRVKQAAASAIGSGWYREDVNAVLDRVHDSAKALVRIRKNTERADSVGANTPNLAGHPNWPVEEP